jgi:hypothetical protein
MPLRAPAPGVEVADHVPDRALGDRERHRHDRLEQDRVGALEGLAHRQGPGRPEGVLGGVHGVRGPVEEPHADAAHREAAERPLAEGVLTAPGHRRDEAPGDDAALDLVHELEVVAVQRLDGDVAVAELAAPARLLLVAAVRRGRAADGLAVGDARRPQIHLDPEARAQAVHRHLDVDLREPGDDLLARLRVPVQVERRVLLLQALERGEELLLVPLGLGRDREGHDGRGQRDRRHPDRLVTGGEPVAGARLLELGDLPEVAGAQRRGHLAQALLVVGAGVHHLHVRAQRPLVDPEPVHAPGERVGLRLEHVGEQLAVGLGLQDDVAEVQRPVQDG